MEPCKVTFEEAPNTHSGTNQWQPTGDFRTQEQDAL